MNKSNGNYNIFSLRLQWNTRGIKHERETTKKQDSPLYKFLQYGTCMVATSADALVTALFNVLQHSCCHHTWNVTLSGFKTSLHSKRILCFGPSRNDN
ncbi:hypothetical protein QTP88_008471 [Uroleucon formosanum]